MQKFGLDTLQTGKATSLEREIAKEKAAALGLAGAKLRRSLATYRKSLRHDGPTADRDRLLAQIAEDLSALLVQREILGLVHENVAWVLKTYDIPAEALSMLGIAEGK